MNMRTLLMSTVLAGIISVSGLGAAAQDEDQMMQLTTDNTTFALDLFHALQTDGAENVILSPYSISQALAMVYAGAEGDTAAQMAEALNFTLPQPALHEAFSAINSDLIERGNEEADEDSYVSARVLRIANALWGEQTYPFSQSYMDRVSQYYGAGLQLTDFVNEPESAREAINAWVEEQTEDRIQDIVPQGAINEATRLVLANAIYFYGAWQEPFMEHSTSDQPFHLVDGSTVTVPTMTQHARFAYAEGDGFQAVELQYQGNGLAFTVLMPETGTFEDFVAVLNAETLNTALASLSSRDVMLYLPKFEFDYATSVAGTLAAMGMTDAFSPTTADFGGMVEGNPSERLFIGDILHKAFIGVDEAGTEAAAATVVVMVGSAAVEQPEPLEVRIDQPFVFVIRDQVTGSILFMGTVVDPSA